MVFIFGHLRTLSNPVYGSSSWLSINFWINSVAEITDTFGKAMASSISKCLSSVHMKCALPAIAQSTNLLSSGLNSSHLEPAAKYGVRSWLLLHSSTFDGDGFNFWRADWSRFARNSINNLRNSIISSSERSLANIWSNSSCTLLKGCFNEVVMYSCLVQI